MEQHVSLITLAVADLAADPAGFHWEVAHNPGPEFDFVVAGR
ncbi:hypothetical protein [Tessaracoccus defluvii]|nr:hypothetical protein [Tessaracoccus defluvii]